MDTIAVFDFDGTITTKDTFVDFCLYAFGPIAFAKKAFCSVIPAFLYATRLWCGHKAKEKIFARFFAGMSEQEFNRLCLSYCTEHVNKICKPEAVDKINWHGQQNHKLVIISASIAGWIKPWAQKNGFEEVMATVPEIKNGVLTGNFASRNCNGEEKVSRFRKKYNRADFFLYAYGNSVGDKPLLSIADKSFYNGFL